MILMAADKKGRWNNYKVAGDTLTCLNEWSPKSDVPRMMANHKDRKTCGKTGYTEFAKDSKASE